MKLRNGKDTEKKRVRIKEELSTNIFMYIDKEQRAEYFEISRTNCKVNLLFRKEIKNQLKQEIESI
jgi:uncharacterized OsmC-like protein